MGRPVHMLANMKGRALVMLLRADGLLKHWEGHSCPRCSEGCMSPLYFDKVKKIWVHRCNAKGCQARIQPHDYHPIFFGVSGPQQTPLALQAAVLCCALTGVPNSSVPALLDIHTKAVERIYTNLEVARAMYVQSEEKKIVFGARRKWADVEADEVDLGKEEVAKSVKSRGKVQWEQWGGLVERGCPSTLVLYRLRATLTAKRAPGPELLPNTWPTEKSFFTLMGRVPIN